VWQNGGRRAAGPRIARGGREPVRFLSQRRSKHQAGVAVVPGRGLFEVYQAGALTVLGFGGRDVLDDYNVAQCRDEIMQLVRQHRCTALAFDLTGVKLVPSGLLGLLASLKKLGIEVHVFNPSEDMREVLEITKLKQFMEVHDVEVGRA
jgi:anti-sigma B factor antagonist